MKAAFVYVDSNNSPIFRVQKTGTLIGRLNLFISASSVSSPMYFFGGHETGSEYGQN
jgi:hypothetical protein